MARIQYKEWTLRKAEEQREKKEMKKKIKRAMQLEAQEKKHAREMLVSLSTLQPF